MSRRAGGAFFALPVTASATERYGSLDGFEPEHLTGPWAIDSEALGSPQLRAALRTETGEAFIGGPCWFRWLSEDEPHQRLEWIPLIYREVRVEEESDRLHIVPARDGWDMCPLVSQFLEQHDVPIVEPLDEMLPDVLTLAESKAAEDGRGLTQALVDAFALAVPELGELLARARDDFPVDRAEFVPSPWVLFTATAGESAVAPHLLREYDRLERRVATAPQSFGGLALLEHSSGVTGQGGSGVTSIVPLNDSQRLAVEAALAGRPVTVIGAPPDGDRSQVIASILLNAWASSTSVLFACEDNQAIDVVCERLRALESKFEIAIYAAEPQTDEIAAALGRTLELVKDRLGETHYGGSPSARRRTQLTEKKQHLQQLLDNQVPQRVNEAIESAVESHTAQRQALSELASRREDLVAELRNLGIEEEPDDVDERVVDPLRKWRNGIEATRRLIEKDELRTAALQGELSAARAARDSVLSSHQIETRSDQPSSWLLDEPGFEAFDQALVALAETVRQAKEIDLAEQSWEKAYDSWPSSRVAAKWERKARELASLIRPAGIDMKEKSEEIDAAREALESARRSVQEATKTSSLDVRGEDLDEWASAYAELNALPPTKLAFLQQSRSAELVERLEEMERRFRSTFPPHIWTSVGSLERSGRTRLSVIVEKAREWVSARDAWERMSSVQEEIEAQSDALRRRLVALGARALTSEVTPTGCAAIASKLSAKASVATSAAAAWSKRETKERLPAQMADLAVRIRAAGAGSPLKERWLTGAGASLMAALDSVAKDPRMETVATVREEALESAAADPALRDWRRAYEAEKEAVAIAEELERIPSRAARVAHWKSRRPAFMPPGLDVASALDDDDDAPVWALLQGCEEWSRKWATYRDRDAPELEQTANAEGAKAIRHIGEAARALPDCKEKAWLASFESGTRAGETWPVEEITEQATPWRPEGLQAEIEEIDAQLERIAFETAREQWLERVAYDSEVLRALDALRAHYHDHGQRNEEPDHAHFERSLKAQPVWGTTALSARAIPMEPGLFDLLVIDEAAQCTLTNALPLIFRAKRLVVIGDPRQSPPMESLAVDAERTLAERFGVEEWLAHYGHSGRDVYKAAVGALPHRETDVISLAEGT